MHWGMAELAYLLYFLTGSFSGARVIGGVDSLTIEF
jgi:hypothetical protein